MRYVTVQSVASRLIDHFNVEMSLDQIIIHSAQVLKNMGMLALNREVIKATVTNFALNTPARVRQVRGVIRLDNYYDLGMTVVIQDVYQPPQTVWTSTDEALADLTNDCVRNNYVPQLIGPYINFVYDCPFLRFNETDIDVALITTSMKVDEKGWPMLPEEAFEACVYYCLYVYTQPLFMLGKVPPVVFAEIKEWKNQKMRFAESSLMFTQLSQNEMDNVLNVMTSFDRKAFGITS